MTTFSINRILVSSAFALAVMGSAAIAAPDCSKEPADKWMTEDAMKAKAAEMGYTKIKTFKTSGSCYEIYGWNKDGKKAEVYFNPVTGDVVKAEVEG